MKLKDDRKIIIKDSYGDECLADTFSRNDSNVVNSKPQGWVEVYEVDENGTEKLLSKSNLVVYLGRETIAQRMFGLDNASSATTKDETISWFGIGQGGATMGDPLTPVPPVSTDTDLAGEIPISNIDQSCADFRNGAFFKKPIETIEFEQDAFNDNAWLIVKTISRVSLSDAVSANINEAALFTSDGGAIASYPGPFHMFSKVTFPTVVKTTTRQILFIWYIYF